MPKVPLSQIPNAPQPVVMPSGGNIGGVSLSHTQNLLMQPTLPANAFLAETDGLQAIARAFAGVSAAADRISDTLHRDEVIKQTHDAKSQMQKVYDDYMAELAEKPGTDPATWHTELERRYASLNQKLLAGKELSNDAIDAIKMEGVDYQLRVLGDVKRKAGEEIHNRATFALDNSRQAALKVGDFDGALRTIDAMEAGHHIAPEVAGGFREHVNTERNKWNLEKESMSYIKLGYDFKDIEVYIEGSEAFQSLPRTIQNRTLDRIEIEWRQYDRQQLQDALELIDGGGIKTEDRIRESYSDAFFVRHKGPLSKALKGEFKFDQKVFNELAYEITGTTPEADPAKQAIQKEAMKTKVDDLMPEGKRKTLHDLIDGQFSDKPSARVKSSLVQQVKQAKKLGILGATDTLQGFQAAGLIETELLEAIDEWASKNPNAKPKEAQEFLNYLVQYKGLAPGPDTRGLFERIAPTFLGGKPDPNQGKDWRVPSLTNPESYPSPAQTPTPLPLTSKASDYRKRGTH